MHFFKDLLSIFYPNLCINCDKHLFSSETILCNSCKNDLPIIDILDFHSNMITSVFYGKSIIYKGYSFLFYRKKNSTQKLIHKLKYENREDIGVFLANWIGHELHKRDEFLNVDYILPVPLHKEKMKQRGYNQLTVFGETLARKITCEYLPNVLIRTSSSKTQTLKIRFERFNNIHTKFKLTNTSSLKNKHVLLIDDVITSGATLETCCNELQKVKNIKISILTIAYTEKT